MKYLKSTFLIVAFITFGCQEIPNKKTANRFDFDLVEHYFDVQNPIIEKKLHQMRSQEYNVTEINYLRLIQADYPSSITDKSFFALLKMPHIKMDTVSQNGNRQLKQIFTKKICDDFASKGCTPIYRDIFVFKKNFKVTGVAKICFECEIIYFVDSNGIWQRFGDSCREFSLLRNIK